MITKKRLKRFSKQMFCRHSWHDILIFSAGRISHTLVRGCTKCEKSKIIFKGTRAEWQNRQENS